MDLLTGYGSDDSNENGEKRNDATKDPVILVEAPSTLPTATTTMTTTATATTTRRGRKLLSLTAVLPQHILDQLTKAQMQGNIDGDMDDDDEDGTYRTSSKRDSSMPDKKAAPNHVHTVKDAGINHLLSDLHAAPMKHAMKQSTLLTSNNGTGEKLGAAFLTSSVHVSTTHKLGENSEVRDIHGNTKDEKGISQPTSSVSKYLLSVPKPTDVPRPSATVYAARVELENDSELQPPFPPPDPPESLMDTTTTAYNDHSDYASRKRSRKDLEHALRQGHLHAIQDDSRVAHLVQASPTAYQPDEQSYAVPVAGVKVVPTALYDPSQGQAVVGSGGHKGRGKNQIHHLMAAAADLELARARGQAPAASNAQHRVNAKRKYGW
jgi:hypothetical protein